MPASDRPGFTVWLTGLSGGRHVALGEAQEPAESAALLVARLDELEPL